MARAMETLRGSYDGFQQSDLDAFVRWANGQVRVLMRGRYFGG